MTGLKKPKAASAIPITLYKKAPEQVLADLGAGPAQDIDRIRDKRRIAARQRAVRCVHGDISAGRHDDTDVRCGQCRGAINAIADHRDHPAFALELGDRLRLVLGQAQDMSSMPMSKRRLP